MFAGMVCWCEVVCCDCDCCSKLLLGVCGSMVDDFSCVIAQFYRVYIHRAPTKLHDVSESRSGAVRVLFEE